MAPARPKKTTSRTPAKKTTAVKKSSAKKQPAQKSAAKSAAAKRSTKATPRRKVATAADSVDEQLARFRSMRAFNATAEPSGTTKSPNASSPNTFHFVIQKPAAYHLNCACR